MSLCYFGKLSAPVKQILCNYYCMTLFGCVLWQIDHNNIDILCIARRRAIRQVWLLSHTTQSSLLPQLCHSLPLHDDICSRTLSFTRRCLLHRSALSQVLQFMRIYLRVRCHQSDAVQRLVCVDTISVTSCQSGETCACETTFQHLSCEKECHCGRVSARTG
jgi:hypothetical protein